MPVVRRLFHPVLSVAAATLILAAPAASAFPTPVWLAPTTAPDPGETITAIGVSGIASSQGRVVVGWGIAADGHDVLRVRIRDTDGTWQPAAVDLSSRSVTVADPAWVAAPNGDIVAIWRVVGSPDQVQVSRLAHDQSTFAAPITVSDASHSAGSPEITVDGDSNVIAVWKDNDFTDVRIATAVLPPDSPTVGAVVYASAPGETADYPAIAADASGAERIIWIQQDGSNYRVRTATRGGASDAWQIDPTAISADVPQAGYTALGMTSTGNAVAAWTTADGSYGDIRTRRAVYSVQTDSWGPEDLLYSGNSFAPRVAMTPRGDAVVTVMQTTDPVVGYGTSLMNGASSWEPPQAFGAPSDLSGVGGLYARSDNRVYAAVIRGAGLTSALPAVGTWDPATGAWSISEPLTDEFSYPQGGGAMSGDDAGNLIMVWASADRKAMVAGADGAPPRLSDVTVPRTGTAGTPVAVSATATDLWSSVTTRWDFGDGPVGESSRHTYDEQGTYTVRVTATDAVGHSVTSDPQTIVIAPRPAERTEPPVNPPVVQAPIIEARLSGRTITLNARVNLRSGKKCSGKATATTVLGTTTYRAALKLAEVGGKCMGTGTIKLKKTPSTRTRLRVTISAKTIKTRTISTKRG